jgi:hypothetical protein
MLPSALAVRVGFKPSGESNDNRLLDLQRPLLRWAPKGIVRSWDGVTGGHGLKPYRATACSPVTSSAPEPSCPSLVLE